MNKDNSRKMFTLDAPDDCRSQVTAELENAPTYRINMKPDKQSPRIITVNSIGAKQTITSDTELVSRSLRQKLGKRVTTAAEKPMRYEKVATLGEGGTGMVYEMVGRFGEVFLIDWGAAS